tara:strand:+ start:160 stop:564 length:405 start_codon:yes stop_codon:yes gene_type:complete
MAVQNRSFLKTKNRDFNNILDSIQTQKDVLRHEGTVPTLTVTTAGDGTCTIDAASTDVAGNVTFADTWADGDTLLVTYSTAYATAPQVILSNIYNASGIALIEYDLVTSAAAGFTITASGTAAGKLSYFVIETV